MTIKSGREYAFNKLDIGSLQYMDRGYRFAYIPEEIKGHVHLKTCGNDKLISENEQCFSFDVDRPVDIYILFADKFPVIPDWLKSYERIRKNITRQDSDPNNLKGYFSLYKHYFPEGKIIFNGCSPEVMLKRKDYVLSMGSTFCMYTLCIIPCSES